MNEPPAPDRHELNRIILHATSALADAVTDGAEARRAERETRAALNALLADSQKRIAATEGEVAPLKRKLARLEETQTAAALRDADRWRKHAMDLWRALSDITRMLDVRAMRERAFLAMKEDPNAEQTEQEAG